MYHVIGHHTTLRCNRLHPTMRLLVVRSSSSSTLLLVVILSISILQELPSASGKPGDPKQGNPPGSGPGDVIAKGDAPQQEQPQQEDGRGDISGTAYAGDPAVTEDIEHVAEGVEDAIGGGELTKEEKRARKKELRREKNAALRGNKATRQESNVDELCFPKKLNNLDAFIEEVYEIANTLELPPEYYEDPCRGRNCADPCFSPRTEFVDGVVSREVIDFGFCRGEGEGGSFCRVFDMTNNDPYGFYKDAYLDDIKTSCASSAPAVTLESSSWSITLQQTGSGTSPVGDEKTNTVPRSISNTKTQRWCSECLMCLKATHVTGCISMCLSMCD